MTAGNCVKFVFSRNLDRLIREKRLCGKDIAKELGVSPTTFSRWRKGVDFPSYENIRKIRKILSISLSELFFDKGN